MVHNRSQFTNERNAKVEIVLKKKDKSAAVRENISPDDNYGNMFIQEIWQH